MPKIRVIADTNVVLESFRVGCWKELSTHYSVETVEKCVEEALTGNPADSRYVLVPANELNGGLTSKHAVSAADLAALVLAHPHCATLDDGEKHVLAFLHAKKLLPSAAIVLSTADKAALVAAHDLGWLIGVTSLDALAKNAGIARHKREALARQYREDWLISVRTKIVLGVIP